MSQQFRRIPLDEFLRQAPSILDGITTRGETVLIEHKGRFFTLGAYSAYRKRAPARPQPPNMQDSLWSHARSSDTHLETKGATATDVADQPAEFAAQAAPSHRTTAPSDVPPALDL